MTNEMNLMNMDERQRLAWFTSVPNWGTKTRTSKSTAIANSHTTGDFHHARRNRSQ